jgi:hypothetical protein
MTRAAERLAPQNPFSTRCVRPGALPFLFPPGAGLGDLVERLRAGGWWGQIIGPHGSGKSTLLAALVPELRRLGRLPYPVTLHDGTRRLPAEAERAIFSPRLPDTIVVVIDGYEQLSRWNRWRLKRQCRRRRFGLLITAHIPLGLPDLYHTDVTPDLVQRVVARLAPAEADRPAGPAEVTARLAARNGNLREVLFDLYDLYEQRRRQPFPVDTRGENG